MYCYQCINYLTMEETIAYNSAYISLNLLDELDYCLGGYGKPTIEFLFSLNTFVETFIGSSNFYTSLDELNHLNLTTPALFPNGRPILNLVVREGGLKFVNGIVDNPGTEIYFGDAHNRTRREAQQDFVIEYGNTFHEKYFIQSDINVTIERIPMVTSRFEDGLFIVSEVENTSSELVSNLINVSNSSNIQTTLPIYLYGEQVSSLANKPFSIQSLERIAKLHEIGMEDLLKSLKYQYLPVPPFTNILLSQVNSVYEIPQKLTQLRHDFQELRTKFAELEKDIFEAATMKHQLEARRKFLDFWIAFNRKYVDKKHRIFYGNLDLADGGDIDKGLDTFIDNGNIVDALKDLNLTKIAGNALGKGYNWINDKKIINRFKGLTNIWELFYESKSITQQVKHIEKLFGVQYSKADIEKVHSHVRTKLANIPNSIRNTPE